MAHVMQRLGIRTVFVGGPFKAWVDEHGLMSNERKQRYLSLIDYFEAAGCTVYNAHRREQWGRAFLTPEECSQLDYEEISRADLFVAFPGSPASPGTHVEIGWATGMRKPTVLLLEAGEPYAFLVTGLPAWTPTVTLEYTVGPDFLPALEEAVERVVPDRRGSGSTPASEPRLLTE